MGRPARIEPDNRTSLTIRIDPELLARFKIALLTRRPRRKMTAWIIGRIEQFVVETEYYGPKT